MFVVANSAVDFMNVYHAFVEMPPGSKTFLYQFNNYWYLPKKIIITRAEGKQYDTVSFLYEI